MRIVMTLVFALLLFTPSILSAEADQTDWAGGGDAGDPVASWGSSFASADGISWRALPGQLSLSSTPLTVATKHVVAGSLGDAYGLYVVDFDGDGDDDVLGTTNQARAVVIWFNQGDSPPTFLAHTVDALFPGGTSVHPFDVDSDGDLDLVGAAQTPGNRIAWWRNDGGDPLSWNKQIIDDSVPVACNVFAVDIDGDGDGDVLSTSWTGNFIALWRNNGGDPVQWSRETIDDAFAAAHSAFAGDVDGDGDADVVGTAANADAVVLFLNDGGVPVVWSQQEICSDMGGVRYATMADVDNDGRLDLAAASADGKLRWWHNDGGDPIQWQAQDICTGCLGGHYVIFADITGNGLLDAINVPWMMQSVYWFSNEGGDPVEWTSHRVESGFPTPLTAFPGDMDGDGDIDIVAASADLAEIAWWELTDFVAEGYLESSVLDFGQPGNAAEISWTATVPFGTELNLRVRTADSVQQLGEWSSPISRPEDLFGVFHRFVQYRVEMRSDDPTVSPILTAVSVDQGWPGRPDNLDPVGTSMD